MSLLSLISIGNLSLGVTVFILSRIKNLWLKVGFVFVAALLLKFRSGIDPQNIAFIVSALIGGITAEILPFRKGVNVLLSLIISLVVFNAYLWFF